MPSDQVFPRQKKADLSPLKAKPLRNPGQTLDEAFDSLLNDRLLPYLLLPAMLWVIALDDWIGRWVTVRRGPLLYGSAAVGLTAWSAWRIRDLRRVAANIKLGRDGEKAVGQFLEGLRVSGARVFHDIPADGFNLDHVVISDRGVFAIETKTWRKPRPGASISVRDGRLYRDHRPVKVNPIEQAAAQAAWLRQLLKEFTGKNFPVRPVLVFPGWFVEPIDPETIGRVWVLEPKALPEFIEREPESIAPSDVAMVAFHLSRYIRLHGSEPRDIKDAIRGGSR